jgi:3-methyladenine DNA glycosylase/8-oxoguanine DNA glycosylase
VPIGAILGVFRRGPADPTCRADDDGTWWRAMTTPAGAATLACRTAADGVEATAWGPGADWVLDCLPSLLGGGDVLDGFVAHHDVVASSHRRFPHWRVPRSGLVIDALVPAVIEQKVTGKEAFAAYRRLVTRYGEPAPGPGPLIVPPTPEQWLAIPSWEWLKAGVDPARTRTVRAALSRANRLEQCTAVTKEDARRRLEAIPGVGVWTSAEVAQRALGDADALSVGDYHVARSIGWALVGEELDDAGMLEVLQPYTGHRYRVQRLLELAGIGHPRRGPRRTLPTHLPH